MQRAWNNWYHVTGSTYGTWLRGDPRGWRSWKHREHVVGDYKNPPPAGMYDEVFERSRRLMKRHRVVLSLSQREHACSSMVAALRFHSVDVVAVAVAVGPKHFHILARFEAAPGHPLPAAVAIAGIAIVPRPSRIRTPRHLVGIAKKRAALALSSAGLLPKGGVWGKRCRSRLIRDREHQLRVVRYIMEHVEEGAVVWCMGRLYRPEL